MSFIANSSVPRKYVYLVVNKPKQIKNYSDIVIAAFENLTNANKYVAKHKLDTNQVMSILVDDKQWLALN